MTIMLVRLSMKLLLLAAERDGKDPVIHVIIELLTVPRLDPSTHSSHVLLFEMTISHCLILFELGLLFVKAKIILTDMGNFMDVGEVIYQQTGATSWDSSGIGPLVQFVPLTFEEWVPTYMVRYLKSANMPRLEFRL